MKLRHVLDIGDLSPEEMRYVLDRAEVKDPPQELAGRGMALIFEKPSNRTRNSTEMAVVGLGGHPVSIGAGEIGLDIRESVEDVTHTLAQYHALLGARVFAHRTLERMARLDVIPVVNLLSDKSHPLQALADLLTMRQRWGKLEGHRIAWVGDGNNVARSLLLACARTGIDFAIASPAGHALDSVDIDAGRAGGIKVEVTDRPEVAVSGADAVITDTWVSMGQEDDADARLDAFRRFQVDSALMKRAASEALFLHCLPAHRGQEVTDEVIDGKGSVIWQEAANRLHAARGLLWWLTQENQ